MRKYAIIIVIVAAVFAIAVLPQAAEKVTAPVAKAEVKLGPQVTCPLTGDPINKNVYTDYKGERIYFCCPACQPDFEKDPAKYLKVLADKGEKPEAVPVKTK